MQHPFNKEHLLPKYPFKQAIFLCHMQRAFQFTAAFLICRIHVKKCNIQCTKAIFLENPAKMTMLLAHSNFLIRQHSILVKKPCSCKTNLTHGIFLLKRRSLPCLLSLKTILSFGERFHLIYMKDLCSCLSQLFLSFCTGHFPRIIP